MYDPLVETVELYLPPAAGTLKLVGLTESARFLPACDTVYSTASALTDPSLIRTLTFADLSSKPAFSDTDTPKLVLLSSKELKEGDTQESVASTVPCTLPTTPFPDGNEKCLVFACTAAASILSSFVSVKVTTSTGFLRVT